MTAMDRSQLERIITLADLDKVAHTVGKMNEILLLADKQPKGWRNMYGTALEALVTKSIERATDGQLREIMNSVPRMSSIAYILLLRRPQAHPVPEKASEPEQEFGERNPYRPFSSKKKEAAPAPATPKRHTALKGTSGNNDEVDELLTPDSESSLFKLHVLYKPTGQAFDKTTGEVYEKGYEGWIYSRDYMSERRHFSTDGALRTVEMMLKGGIKPKDIFGYGCIRGQGFNGWTYNHRKIIKEANEGHPRNGILLKASIYFNRLTQPTAAGPKAIELFTYRLPQ